MPVRDGAICTRTVALNCTIVISADYHRDSRQEFAKVGGIFPILHVVILLDASN